MRMRRFFWLVTIACLISAVPTLAHHRPGHDGGGTNGGGFPPSDVSTIAHWDEVAGWRIQGDSARPCVLNTAAQDGKYGIYGCQKGGAELTIDLSGLDWQQIARKGDENLCRTLEDVGITAVPNSEYGYHWEEICTPESCSIRVQHWFFENHNIDGVGLIRFAAYADAEPAANGDLNPFVDEQQLEIDEIVIDLRGFGTNKTVAECRFTGVTDAVFTSTPQP